MGCDQLGLLLWKNYIVRKRQPGILALILLWPIAVFMILYTVRDNVDPEYHPTCHFPARSMPHDGLLPFAQSFICSIGNPCEPLSEYEQVPLFKNATLGPLVMDMQPMLRNETILSAVKTLPQSIQLLKSMAEILTRPEIKALFDRGIRLGDLFNNHDRIKSSLRAQIPRASDTLVDGLLESSIQLYYLIETFGSTNVGDIVCSAESLRKFMILSKEEDYDEISKVLCELDTGKIPDILQELSKHLDFSGLLGMIDRVMAKFRDYDFFQDLKRTVETILKLRSVDKYIPNYLKIHEWLPNAIMLFRNVTFKEIDLSFINKLVNLMDPIYENETDWWTAHHGLVQLNTILGMVKELVENSTTESSDDFFLAIDDIERRLNGIVLNRGQEMKVTQIMDTAFVLLQDGITLTKKFISRHIDQIDLAAEVLNYLRHFFPQHIVNSLTYVNALIENVIKMTHHAAAIHMNTERNIYEICLNHTEFVQKILTNIDPIVYETVVRTFYRLDFQEQFVNDANDTNAGEVICRKETLNVIFDNYKNMEGRSKDIEDLICSDSGKRFITDIYASFHLENFGNIVENTLAALVTMAFKTPVGIERSNVTNLVKVTRSFISFLESPRQDDLDWSIFNANENWTRTFEYYRSKGRLDILGLHLSIARMHGYQSLSYMVVKADLRNMDILADIILKNLRQNPTEWIEEFRKHKYQLVESFYLTVTDKEKVLKILEYSNFTMSYCIDKNASNVIVFPKGSDEKLLKKLICRISESVEKDLALNISNVNLLKDSRRGRKPFNWSAFNGKVVEIYEYIDALIFQEDEKYDPLRLKYLQSNFKTAWTTDLDSKEVWEISVGVLCKLLSVIESPLFDIRASKAWKDLYAIAWATTVVFHSIEVTLDQISLNNRTVKLPQVLEELPETQIFLQAFLKNLPSIVLDGADLISSKVAIQMITDVDEYKSRETDWPCVKNESIGEFFKFRNGSILVLKELERISCKPGAFIHEWRNHPTFRVVKGILNSDNNDPLPVFDWIWGYTMFRRIVNKFDVFIKDTKDVILAENPKLVEHMTALGPEIKQRVDERLMDHQHNSGNILEYLDFEIEKAIDVLHTNLSMSAVWNSGRFKTTDVTLALLKYISNALHQAFSIVIDTLQDGKGDTVNDYLSFYTDSNNINLLALLGFNNDTVIAIIHNKLPYILSTVANGLTEIVVKDKILEMLENGKMLDCHKVFDWWSDARVGLSIKEYTILEKFICNLDPENFNAYVDFIHGVTVLYKKPINEYNSYMLRVIGDIYDFVKVIKRKMNNAIIEAPFSSSYFEDVLSKLINSLEHVEQTEYKITNLKTDWTIGKLTVEGISESLIHMTEALTNLEIQDNEIYTWEMWKNGDVQQLLKILETYPEETIALAFTLCTINATTKRLVPFKELRNTVCHLHFNSEYWTKNNRSHFLMEICTFDPYQLLKTVTSSEFNEVVVNERKELLTVTPLSSSLVKFLEAVNKILISENVRVKSNIFNAMNWKNISEETRALIRLAEISWINNVVNSDYMPLRITETTDPSAMQGYPFVKTTRMVQILNFLTDILSGGDIWQKLRIYYENSRIKPMLTLIENMPNLVLTAVDTFLNSERLNDFGEKVYYGQVNLCDIDRYLIPPSFVKNKGLLSSITNFCQTIVASMGTVPTAFDFIPVDTKTENKFITYNSTTGLVWNASYFADKLYSFQVTSTRVYSEGFKYPKVPAWWTSFEEGTLKYFTEKYKKKDQRTLAHFVVKKIRKMVTDFVKLPSDEKCAGCNTIIIDIINSQLGRHALYTELMCNMSKLNSSEIRNVLIHDFNWNKTANMIENHKQLNRMKTFSEFLDTQEVTLHHIADIIVDFQNKTYSERVDECFHKFVGKPAYTRPGLYIMILTALLDAIQTNTNIVDTAKYHQDIIRLSNLAEEYIPIWKPLREVVKKSDVDLIDRFLPNATINVNVILNKTNRSLCRNISECQDPQILYNFLSSKRAGKALQYDAKAAKYPSIMDISDQLAKSLDLPLIRQKIINWRMDSSWNLTWLKEILRHLNSILTEGGNLLDIAFKIDFQDVSNVLGVPDIVDGVVNLLKDNTIDKIFSSMKELLEDVEPFVDDHDLIQDLYSIITALESMEIFKNLGLLDVKYMISEMFDNWDVVKTYLVDKKVISKEISLILSQAKIDMISVFMKQRNALTLKDTICDPVKLGDMLNVDHAEVTIAEISTTLCTLNDTQTQNIVITLIKNLNFEYILKTMMSANVKNILTNANLTETEGKLVLDNLGVAADLVPFFSEKFSGNLFNAESLKSENEVNDDEPMSSNTFLKDSSKLLCGKTLIDDNSQLYQIISNIQDNTKEDDKKELDSLPTNFCRETYRTVIKMPGGKIIWSYVKPLLRGRILYAPNTVPINKVMSVANSTFVEIDNLAQLMNSFVETLKSLTKLSEMGNSLNELQGVLTSKVMQIAVKSFSGGNFEGDFSKMNFSEIAWRLKTSKRLITMVEMLNDLIDCVLVDRMKGFPSEEELETYARSLMETNEFLAGVVFLEQETGRSKRSLDYGLSDNVTYKIRMDVDYVPSTRRLKNQFWIPGPESSFIEHLRYLRGFVQLQDAVDRAIIKVKSEKEQNWRTLTQQMPYPCWKYVPFQTTLYESQGLQVCFFFALMMCVGSAVRHIVWERESRNSMVMSVMGLKPWRNTFAWFITSFIELSIIITCISLILLAGKILPRSDPFLVLILLFDYAFSIVTFCYMISTMFSSASLSAITTVVMFLLTYMPYIVVIAMEAAIGLGYKLIICLSMSTSFCYGCLYAVRKEVQGTGLTWKNMWEGSSPDDSMSLALVLFMIALDGCIYALIGYFITKYTHSERGFHDLRSRSLWWANARSLYGKPSYLAFVNNLYFTNDVAPHPSTTYQEDENDASSLAISEKQIGVRFENVRKVYNTDTGEVVAVDDFTLQLREGEVTSLLGRNGAGKTTIIKMLTGMLGPTSGEICLNGEEGCKPDIGVCPQDNVLIGTLTPREHMIFYAKLKGPKDNVNMERSINEMLCSLELGRQEHEPVHRLSGGTKRRLCVALAFLGSPKLVILDEPGAGVDPPARRRIWRLIDQHRIGRTVLLSTHHLDEADMLSDTVVIMHKGKILCTGSPLTLKMNYGRGYALHISYPLTDGESVERKRSEALRTIIEDVVPNSNINEISSREVVVNLPFQGKHGANNDIAQVSKVLEDNQKLLGFSYFSLECDTLERVFLDLCSRADNTSILNRDSVNSVASADHMGLSMPNDEIDLIDVEPIPNPSVFRQGKALLKKRLWHFAKDWRSPLATLILPTIFVAVAMGFSLIRPPSEDEPPLALNPRLYDTHPTDFYSIDNSNDPFLQHVSLQLYDRFGGDFAGAWQTLPNDTGTCECLDGQQTCHGVSQAVEGLVQTLPGKPTLDWIVSTHQEYIERRYGGWSLSHWQDDPLFVVWYNNKGHHSMPSYLNALNEAILRASGVHGRLTTLNHPLKLSSDQLNRTTLLQHVADVGIALVLLIAFSLVGAQGARELVRERLSEEKRILYLAGVHPVTYWTAALIWDFLVFACSICLAIIVFQIFGLPTYVARDNLAGVCLLLFLFAWAAIPFSHLAEKAFDDSSLSNMVLFCVNTFIGVSSLATILVIDILGKSQAAADARKALHRILMIFPQYVLGDALVELSKNDITAELLTKFRMNTYKSPLGWDLLGVHFVFLAVIGIIFFVINLFIECRLLPDIKKQNVNYEDIREDDDVITERTRVESGMADEDILKTIKLRKEYRSVYGTNVAVQNLSFGVQTGKCFGLLGANGAGKSTTFKMLTTELIPTAGRIVLKGKDVGSGPLCNGEVGYCPQTEALDGFLTPHQCLTIHAEVCGLSNVPITVERTLKRLDLLKYAHQRVSSLSGGNKRKLCTAISVMAPVSVVLMDEPTSGMDPATKELVARVVRHVTKNQSCVILTSHSVADCESLCNKVGILAKAGLRCIGTPQHLKHKFGEGYVAFLRFGQPTSASELRRAIANHFPQAIISSRQASAVRLLVPRSEEMPLSSSFVKVKLIAEELKATDFTLVQSSLDQVLVNFSEELEDESIDAAANGFTNVYPNMDTIHMNTF